MNLTQLWVVLGAAVFTLIFWRPWTAERRRMIAGWVFIALGIALLAATPLFGARWSAEVSNAFLQIAAIQFLAAVLFQTLVRRRTVHLILSELAVNLSYLAVLFHLLSRLGTDVNGLIATSTVVTAIIGLSLQDILVNSVGGVVMQLEREIAPGDYIWTEHGAGYVRKIRTRFTAIETLDLDTVLIPNQMMTRGTVRISSNRHRISIPLHLPYDHRPSEVVQRVQEALRTSPLEGVASKPEPFCVVAHFHPGHIEYTVYAYLTYPGLESKPRSEILTVVYFALSRAGIYLTGISQRIDIARAHEVAQQLSDLEFCVANLNKNDVFRILKAEELDFLAGRLKRLSFAPGEVVVSQGEEGSSLYLVTHGQLRVMLSDGGERSEQIAVLEPGSLFGEMSLLTGARRSASVIAIDQVDCERLDKAAFAEVLIKRPEVADHISRVVTERQSSLDQARQKMSSTPQLQATTQNLLERIQSFFGLSEP